MSLTLNLHCSKRTWSGPPERSPDPAAGALTPHWLVFPNYDVKNRVRLEFDLKDFESSAATHVSHWINRFGPSPGQLTAIFVWYHYLAELFMAKFNLCEWTLHARPALNIPATKVGSNLTFG
jgi:hypothetical protein